MPRPIRVELPTVIGRPIDVVFRALSDEREAHHWRARTRAAEYDVGGPGVVGAKFWRDGADGRRTHEVTACEPFEIYATHELERDAVESVVCESIDPLQTRVELTVERPATGLERWLTALGMRREVRRVELELAAAKRWLEADAV